MKPIKLLISHCLFISFTICCILSCKDYANPKTFDLLSENLKESNKQLMVETNKIFRDIEKKIPVVETKDRALIGLLKAKQIKSLVNNLSTSIDNYKNNISFSQSQFQETIKKFTDSLSLVDTKFKKNLPRNLKV